MIRAVIGGAVLVWWIGWSALADPASECGFTNASQVEIADCVAEAERVADLSMNQAYSFARAAAKELDDVSSAAVSSATALEAGQNAWLQYRDQHCDFVGTTFGGGSGTGIAIRSCRVELSRERARVLMRYAQ